jgi:antirestriction protein ArdC
MPWSKPWGNPGGFVMPRRHTGARYRGINILLLWARSEETGYRSPYWMTFQQALEYGGHSVGCHLNNAKGELSANIGLVLTPPAYLG